MEKNINTSQERTKKKTERTKYLFSCSKALYPRSTDVPYTPRTYTACICTTVLVNLLRRFRQLRQLSAKLVQLPLTVLPVRQLRQLLHPDKLRSTPFNTVQHRPPVNSLRLLQSIPFTSSISTPIHKDEPLHAVSPCSYTPSQM
ncbi:uncharacterized protein YALI1_A19089g [Yarrowia lipolytica]|uniref:Uncharacterized protein n=1 Tax=Yarrowia lipolytica TaxID=4952 RepID=A0A1D8N5B5_YARLL|nr:hypothetical protein YALI1_A19089g [Yarrowia lipolytica]